MCKKVRVLVYSDRRIKVEEIANALHISHGSVSTTLHDRLGMHKLTARSVPNSLSDEQMATRASVYSALLKRFRSKEDDFLSRLVTVDETWVHYYEPENKARIQLHYQVCYVDNSFICNELSFRHHSEGRVFNETILFRLTISHQNPFVFSVSVFNSQKYTLTLNLRPNVGLTYAISIVK